MESEEKSLFLSHYQEACYEVDVALSALTAQRNAAARSFNSITRSPSLWSVLQQHLRNPHRDQAVVGLHSMACDSSRQISMIQSIPLCSCAREPWRDGSLPRRTQYLVPGLEEWSHSPKLLLFHPTGHFSGDGSQTDVPAFTKTSRQGSRSTSCSRSGPTLTAVSSDQHI